MVRSQRESQVTRQARRDDVRSNAAAPLSEEKKVGDVPLSLDAAQEKGDGPHHYPKSCGYFHSSQLPSRRQTPVCFHRDGRGVFSGGPVDWPSARMSARWPLCAWCTHSFDVFQREGRNDSSGDTYTFLRERVVRSYMRRTHVRTCCWNRRVTLHTSIKKKNRLQQE